MNNAHYIKGEDDRDAAINDCLKDNDFAWRWRISQSPNVAPKRKRHLVEWCDNYIQEYMSATAEHHSEMSDPYSHYGVRRSDF